MLVNFRVEEPVSAACRFCFASTHVRAVGGKCSVAVCDVCWQALRALGCVRIPERVELIPKGMEEAEHGGRW